MNKKIRTRYAPSPTGFLHIGGARSALFTYLTAKSMGGEFIIRTEDTDIERNIKNGESSQIENLAWLGIIADESPVKPGKYGPYRQSEKIEKYQELAKKLVSEKKAYYCFCSTEELDEERRRAEAIGDTPRYSRKCRKLTQEEIDINFKSGIASVIRLKIDDAKFYDFDDLIRGKISVPGTAMTDPIILKSNDMPTYNFANVIDDYDMKISHITRGEEHISNTSYQIAITNALDFNWTFEYAHMSVIVNEDGKKLSKRDTDTKQFIADYKNLGYVPEAICNFIGLLGWSPEDNSEIKTLKQFEEQFKIERCSKSSSTFDISKMNFLASQYIKKLPDDEFLEFVRPFVKKEFKGDEEWFNILALSFKNQITYAKEINSLAQALLTTNKLTGEQKDLIKNPDSQRVLKCFLEQVRHIGEWTTDNIQNAIIESGKTSGIKGKKLYMPLRLSATRNPNGPELKNVIYLLGKRMIKDNIIGDLL